MRKLVLAATALISLSFAGVSVAQNSWGWSAQLAAVAEQVVYSKYSSNLRTREWDESIKVHVSATQPAGLTIEKGLEAVALMGGRPKSYAGTFWKMPSFETKVLPGNSEDGESAVHWRAASRIGGTHFAWHVGQSDLPFRIIVDGRFVGPKGGVVPVSEGGSGYVEVTLPPTEDGLNWHDVAIEGRGAQYFKSILLDSFGFAAANRSTFRILGFGDSYSNSAGADVPGDGFLVVAGDLLGTMDVWQSGVGGAGWLNPGPNNDYLPTERLDFVKRSGPWDVIVVAEGLNDIVKYREGIPAAVRQTLLSMRSSSPEALIFVVGPWDPAAPGEPPGNHFKVRADIVEGIESMPGVVFLDPTGVAFPKKDGTHPTTEGHRILGEWLAQQIQATVIKLMPHRVAG